MSNPGDPEWIKLQWAASCAGCGERIERNDESFFVPETRCHYGGECGCGDDAERDFSAQVFDEEQGVSYP